MSAPPNLSLKKQAIALGLATTGRSQDQLAAALAAAPRLRENQMALAFGFGDSHTQANTDLNIMAQHPSNMGGTSYISLAAIRSNGRIRLGRNAGVLGQTTTTILTRLWSDVLRYRPQIVSILAGTNDVGTGVPIATTEANFEAMISACLKAGALPVMCTIPPRDDQQYAAATLAVNTLIKTLAAKYSLPLVDFYTLLVNPATGAYKAGYSSDGIHALGYAAGEMAVEWLRVMDPYLLPRSPYIARAAADATNLFSNGLFLSVSGTANIPASYTLNGTLGTDRNVLLAPDPTFAPGNTLTITKVSAANIILFGQTVAPGLTTYLPGDRMAFSMQIDVNMPVRDALTWSMKMTCTSSTSDLYLPYNATGNVSGRIYGEFIVPPGTTLINPTLSLNGGAGSVVKVAALVLTNLSTAGHAPRLAPALTVAASATIDTSLAVALLAGAATLPTALSYAQAAGNAGRSQILVVKNTTTGVIALTPAGAENIDGTGGALNVAAKATLRLLPQLAGWIVL